jgi:hypothetical protein
MAERSPQVQIDDLIATSAQGVLRALDARQAGSQRSSAAELVQSGFNVSVHIICGGFPAAVISGLQGGNLPRVSSGQGPQ